MKNRYGNEYSFKKVDDNTYMVVGDLKYWRFGGQEGEEEVNMNDLGFVDPSGGPFMAPGFMIEERKVKRIYVKDDLILFEVT